MDSSEDTGTRQRPAPVALIEWVDRDGRALRAQAVSAWPVHIGRALDCDVVLDDPHVAARHASLTAADGVLTLTLGQTINGAAVGDRHLDSGASTAVSAGELLRLGTTRLRVRLATDPLQPEQPLSRHVAQLSLPHPAVPARWPVLAALTVAVVAIVVLEQWLESNPGTPVSSYLSRVLGVGAALAAWSLVWALVSKLFQGRIDYLAHLRTVLSYMLAWTLVGAALPALSFITGMPWFSRVSDGVGTAILSALMLAHLVLVMPSRRRMLTAGVATMFVVGMGLSAWFTHQNRGRWAGELYAAALLPPAWRLAPAAPPAALLDDVKSLQRALDAQAKEANDADNADGMDAD